MAGTNLHWKENELNPDLWWKTVGRFIIASRTDYKSMGIKAFWYFTLIFDMVYICVFFTVVTAESKNNQTIWMNAEELDQLVTCVFFVHQSMKLSVKPMQII